MKEKKDYKEVSIFQKYTGRENIHSSSALLLIKELYRYNVDYFYKFIKALVDDNSEVNDFLPHFRTQITTEKNDTVPDFSITQEGFSIFAEAKEAGNGFNERQLEGHLKVLDKRNGKKILLLLSPSENEDRILLNKFNKSYKDISIKQISYNKIYQILDEIVDRNKDYSFCDLLEEYFKSNEFERAIFKLKEENEDEDYIKEYIIKSKNYVKFFMENDKLKIKEEEKKNSEEEEKNKIQDE